MKNYMEFELLKIFNFVEKIYFKIFSKFSINNFILSLNIFDNLKEKNLIT